MTPELRRALLRRAERIEKRLGTFEDEPTRTASERQARQIAGAAAAYDAMNRAPQRGRTGRAGRTGDDWSDEMAQEAEQRRRERAANGEPKFKTTTERQLYAAGMLPGYDYDDDDDDE